jgi:excinuclease ABC subunit A
VKLNVAVIRFVATFSAWRASIWLDTKPGCPGFSLSDILDEPTTGLHFHDIEQLLKVLHELTERGNTVVVIEHNLDVIKTADWIIDLGPEGGHRGGTIIASGTPEQVAKNTKSYTGQYLAKVLHVPAAKAASKTLETNVDKKIAGAKSTSKRDYKRD